MGAVQNALQRDGLDPSIMELDPEKSVASQLKKEEADGPPLKDDPKYQKYFKMLKMVSKFQMQPYLLASFFEFVSLILSTALMNRAGFA